MAATALPRPSLPPTGPLPSLPVPKTRKSMSGATPTPSTPNTNPPSSLPTTRTGSNATHNTTSSVPRAQLPNPTSLSQNRALRKTISIGSFPQPPKVGARSNSQASSPSSSTSPADSMVSPPPPKTPTANPNRRSASHAVKRPLRTSSRVSQLRNFTGTPSLLNGGDGKSVSVLNLTSPPLSRTSSAQGLYHSFEDDDAAMTRRGRHRSLDDLRSEGDKHGKDNKGNVIVSVRVRPDVAGNDNRSELEWMVDGRRSLVSYRGKEGGEYTYDNVFAAHDNNAKVYDASVKRLVRRVMEGYHGTVFAYGMTGTGKTFSMQGTATSPGVIPLAITDIFSFIRETPHREFLLRVSYLEIYNEKIHDLLSAPLTAANGIPMQQEEIKLREDSKRGVYATPLKEEIVQSPTQLLRVIARGDNARRVAGTQYNARSSRSHAVVQIVVESRERAPPSADIKAGALPPGGVRVSTLSLIDLAGSERAAESKERRTEGAHINKSLLTLGTVISKLSLDKKGDANANDKDKDKHLPYRDSKLTRLLQPALSGNSLVSILCTIQIGSAGSVATAQNHTIETLNTLKFASRAKNNIVSHAKKAEEAYATGDPGSRALLDRYRMEIVELRKQLEAQNKTDKEAKEAKEVKEEELDRETEAEKAREQEARHEEQMLEMQLARTALKERIEHLNRLILSSRSLGVNAGRSFSSLSMRNGELQQNARSARSSTATIDAPTLRRSSTSASNRSLRAPLSPSVIPEGEIESNELPEEEVDAMGDNGDGTATAALQIRALQADLADKNRYIQTLEKRLLQARRSSHSRVSMQFSPRFTSPITSPVTEDGNPSADQIIREKDAEIAELRARLDDKERMVAALRSATRRRDGAGMSFGGGTTSFQDEKHNDAKDDKRESSSSGGTGSATSSGIFSGTKRSSKSSGGSPVLPNGMNAAKKTNSVLSLNGITGVKTAEEKARRKSKGKSVDEMTRLLDEMITERVQNGHLPNGTAKKRNSAMNSTSIQIVAD